MEAGKRPHRMRLLAHGFRRPNPQLPWHGNGILLPGMGMGWSGQLPFTTPQPV